MGENKSSKVFKIIKQIIKWIWRIILSLFFIAGVFFQAPLKLLALAAVFLLGSTVLPPRYLKWFWAGVGIVVLVLVVWVFLPEDDEGWKPYTFDKELAALEAKYKIPDEENAAVIYNQLVADYNKTEFEDVSCEIDEIIESEYWRSKDYPQVAKWISGHKQLMDNLIQASQFEKCKFDIPSKIFFLFDMDRLGIFRRWAQLLLKASNNDMAEGRTAKGLEKIYCICSIGKHLCQQPSFIDILSGMAVRRITIDSFEKFVIDGKISKKQLDKVESCIEKDKYDWQSDLPRVLDYEKLLMKNMLSLCIYEINANGQIRLAREPEKAIRSMIPDSFNNIPPSPYLIRKLSKASTILKWFFAPSSPQTLSRVVDLEYEKYYKMAEPDYDWSKKPTGLKFSFWSFKLNYKYFIKMQTLILDPTYHTIHDLYLRSESEKKGSSLLIALGRYKDKKGSWPESLDEIKDLTNEENFIDPVNGQSFVYKLADNGFILYSKGKNGIDNGGQPYFGKRDKNNDDIDIWPLKSCAEKNSNGKIEESNDVE